MSDSVTGALKNPRYLSPDDIRERVAQAKADRERAEAAAAAMVNPENLSNPKLEGSNPRPIAISHGLDSIASISAFCGLVALAAVIVSAWFSFNYFSSRQPWPVAVVMAAIIVSCATLLPNVAIFFAKRKGWGILAGAFMAIMAFGTIGFSMATTIGGLYDARSSALRAVDTTAAAARKYQTDTSTLAADLSRAQNAAATARRDEETYRKEVERLMAMEVRDEKAVAAQERKRDAARKVAEAEEKKIPALSQAVRDAQSQAGAAVAVRDDFYSWFGSMFNVSGDLAEFAMSAFPAVFIDLIAPVMLAVVLFLRRKP